MSWWRFLRRPYRSSTAKPPPKPEPGLERPPSYYDESFSNPETGFASHYTQSRYYFLWTVIADRIPRDAKVLEIGCGPGQFAQFLIERGIQTYVGFDFSPKAIQMATQRCPGGSFFLDDALTTGLLRRDDFDTVVCTEVLEHIQEDLKLLGRVPTGVMCHLTVPNFPWRSHVRHFRSAGEAQARYGPFVADPRTDTFLENSQGKMYFLISGRRNNHLSQPRVS